MMYLGWLLFTLCATLLTVLIVLHYDKNHSNDI
ncbi:hypothetical protein Psal071_01375 [Piscirickettsia salmonis]|uniref:Uncharacterized protein n=1 Tax=Piscirickettsia salmonis TaxID=1238 RepID=A0A9Q6Q0J2_PISSA|nr:hypothetical protein KW89_1306 [Piscirickettsia salmonis]OAJ33261.1 hypothetical protein A0O36_02548 [Piscirickettsiaceae bacterium NZ-RLO1]QGN77555.1 hypothetical protein Psal001_01768 [Piscirickettsia salmonis]QGN81142.1 hypothetical protein Psal002_01790 [Piscirickettsia salmonis]QGN84585.1 hypothetical protein Psal003_01641 [Piscirickettsia salmonis]